MADANINDGSVFVFGSNLAGKHYAGAAKFALDYRGAKMGHAKGYCGQSYAIATMDRYLRPLNLSEIKAQVENFICYAQRNKYTIFEVTKIGCGIAGFKESEIAPMFKSAPQNCILPESWR